MWNQVQVKISEKSYVINVNKHQIKFEAFMQLQSS